MNNADKTINSITHITHTSTPIEPEKFKQKSTGFANELKRLHASNFLGLNDNLPIPLICRHIATLEQARTYFQVA